MLVVAGYKEVTKYLDSLEKIKNLKLFYVTKTYPPGKTKKIISLFGDKNKEKFDSAEDLRDRLGLKYKAIIALVEND